ncbi:response regulator transcription factor [Lentzea terrae]|uniref:response regulator transcription factor n=1 Tax=Lentzea terrae TaxID=2200761 RepID=UPI000DD494A7|nr:response regulator transcription factor [Lentzea terrae]
MSVVDDLRQAREAFVRREWVLAYEALSGLEEAELTADDFVSLATTAFLLGQGNDCVQALQRSYQINVDHGEVLAAARSALWLSTVLFHGGEAAIGSGWASRAQRILDDVAGDVAERGFLCYQQLMSHIVKGEFGAAVALAPQVTGYGQRFHEPDLVALGLHCEGRLTIFSGRVADGLRLLDEAMVGVLAGEASPIFAGIVYCSSIEACQEVCDFRRAGEWTRALTIWCDAQPGLVAFTGQCAVHRGQLMRLHGAYGEAVAELEHAARRYAAQGGHQAVGQASYERGEALRLQGDHDAAEAAYEEAAGHGHPAQPGRALLWLARGRREAAAAAVHRLLAEWQDPVHRSQALPAAVEVLVEAGAADEAAPLAQQLREIADSFDCTALQASAAYAAASVALAQGNADVGLAAAREAVSGWNQLSAPHEVARSRVLIGRALRLLGDEESAAGELTAARKVFAELGARPAERAVAELVADREAPGGLSPREIEVLRLVAAGRSNPEIASVLVLSEKTVARHLSNIFAKLDVGSRTAAAAFAFEHRLV